MILLLSALAWAGEVLTLDAALEQAAAQPSVRGDEAALRAAEAGVRVDGAGLLPQVSVGADWTWSSKNSFPDEAGLNADLSPSDDLGANVSLSQQLWDGGKTIRTWKAARMDRLAAEGDLADTVVAVRRDVRLAFFAARAAQELVDVEKAALSNQERHLAQVEAFIQVGNRPEIDRAQARLDLANARLELLRATNSYRIALQELDAAIGRHTGTPYTIGEGTLPAVDGEDAALAELVRSVERPDVAAAKARLQAAEESLAAAKGSLAPDVAASASISADATEFSRAALNWGAGVGLSWTLYGGGQLRGRIAAAEADRDAAQASLDALLLTVEGDIAQAQAEVQSAREAVDVSLAAQAAAQDRLKLAQGRYQAGVGSAIELGDAQIAATRADVGVVQARQDLGSARASLLAALGRR